MELRTIQLEVGDGTSKHLEKFQKKATLPPMSSAEYPTSSFTWRSDRRERWTWRRIGFLLVITAGAAFYVGRLSIEASPTGLAVTKQTDPEPQQSAAAVGTVAQRQATVQPDASTAAPEAMDGAKEKPVDALTEPAKSQSTAVAEGKSSSPSVVLINPETADKVPDGDASKQPVSTTNPKSVAKANANTEAQTSADGGAPTVAPGRRQAKSRPPARANMNVPPSRHDSVVARRGDAYVPPRIPQAAYAEQRGRYDNADGNDERARFEQRYPPRHAEDTPPRGTYEGYDYRREYLRPFQDFRDLREYRRFGGYDDDPYAARRPVLRPMYGGGND
jgi:hypothetical protein